MTRERDFFKDYQLVSKGHVSFGDGEKRCVLGKGTFDVNGLLRLETMIRIEGVKANLISISQLCDQNLVVKFTKNTCKVLNKLEKYILKGSRLSNNCYKVL